jgi:hypothetical protein
MIWIENSQNAIISILLSLSFTSIRIYFFFFFQFQFVFQQTEFATRKIENCMKTNWKFKLKCSLLRKLSPSLKAQRFPSKIMQSIKNTTNTQTKDKNKRTPKVILFCMCIKINFSNKITLPTVFIFWNKMCVDGSVYV